MYENNSKDICYNFPIIPQLRIRMRKLLADKILMNT